MMRHIEKVEVSGPQRLRLMFADGSVKESDFAPLIAKGGVWASLASAEEFARVKIGEGGRYLEWPCGVDACADALWLDSSEQRRAG